MAFRIHGEVSLDGAMFKRGLHQLGGEVAGFAKNFALGAVGVYSIEQAFTKTIESASELVDASDKLSLTVEQLQVLRQAAGDAGVEFDAMSAALAKFNAVRENALKGGKGSAEQLAAFKRLGLSREDLQRQTGADSVMNQVSATARGSNAADIAAELRTVFGKSGTELFGVLQTDFQGLETSMKSMGAVMDSTTAHELDAFADQMGLIGRIVTADIAPILVKFGGALYDVMTVLGLAGTTLGTLITDLMNGRFRGALDDVKEEGDKYLEQRKSAWDEMIEKSLGRKNVPAQAEIADESKEKVAKVKAAKAEKSDALISVGNFLGEGRGAINSVAEQHLQVAKAQLAVSQKQVEVSTEIQKTTADLVKAFKGNIPDWAT